MPGHVTRRTKVRDVTHLIVDAAGDTWQIAIKPVADINGRTSGYTTWVRRQSDQHATFESAEQSGLAMVEVWTGVEIEDRL